MHLWHLHAQNHLVAGTVLKPPLHAPKALVSTTNCLCLPVAAAMSKWWKLLAGALVGVGVFNFYLHSMRIPDLRRESTKAVHSFNIAGDGFERRQCADGDKNCRTWANSGQCGTNPSYMFEGCPVRTACPPNTCRAAAHGHQGCPCSAVLCWACRKSCSWWKTTKQWIFLKESCC